LDEQGIWIGIYHGTLLVYILNSCCFWNHDDVTWDCPKGKVLEKRSEFLYTILGRVRGTIGVL
jgi:hypothetical protein